MVAKNTIDIKSSAGKTLLSVLLNIGAKGYYSLMQHDYIVLPFKLCTPIDFKIGSYVDLRGVFDDALGGKLAKMYYITDKQNPTYNTSTGAYEYQLRLNAYYWLWNNFIFKYTPENAAGEASWSLTAPLDVQMGVFLRNLSALGFTYNGTPYEVEIDDTVENKAVAMTYDNMHLLDALFSMGSKDNWDCDVWVTENVIHFGRCEHGDPVKIELGVEASTMPRSESKGTFATRIYAFGSTRNIPENYRPVDESLTVNGVVQKRLMLPVDTPYIDAYPGMAAHEVVEAIVVFDDIFPRRIGTISDVRTVDRAVTGESGEQVDTFKAYQYRDSELSFKEDYVLPGKELRVIFKSGKLNGLDFAVQFNPENADPAEQLWEIVANEDYGRLLPDETIKPEDGDTYLLYGFDIQLVSDQYTPEAEQELKERTENYVKKTMVDDGTYATTLRNSWVSADPLRRTFDVGQRVKLLNPGYFPAEGRESRVIGWEMNLDIPSDAPIYTIGESTKYSRIGEIEDKVDTLVYKGSKYVGVGGSGVYVVRVNDSTPPSDTNVFSALRSLATFLRKDQEDTAQEVITFLKGLRIAGHYISKVILSPEELEEADDAIMSVLKAVNTFIRKDKADATNFLLKLVGGAEFGNYEAGKSGGKVDAQGTAELLSLLVRGLVTASGIESADFSTGALGTGFTLKIDENGDSYIEVDRMLVRKVATFVELLIQKIRAVGGQIILSPATMNCSRVEEHDTFYRCFFENTDGEKTIAQEFVVGDQARCQTFNVKEGVNENVTNTYYWRLVVGVGDDYIDLSKTDCDAGSTVPQAGDDIVQLGNRTDATRQAAIVLAAYGNDAPYFKMYRGIDSYSLSGKEFISFSRTEVMIIADSLRFSTGESVKDYIDNATGNAITGVDVEYALGDSPTEAPQTGWSTTAPEWQAGKYMWQRTKTTTPKGSSYSEPTCIQGAKGDQGIPGTNGADGKTYYLHIAYANSADGSQGFSTTDSTNKLYIGQYTDTTQDDSPDHKKYSWTKIKGDTGKGVSALEEQYYLSTSNTTQTGGTWQTTCPAWESGKYIWTRTKVTWTDNTVTYTTPVLAEDINGVNEDLQNYKEEVEAKFEATNESITAAVDSSKSYTDEKGESILSQTTSMINVAKDEINLSVDTKIQNMGVGGRNLLRMSGLDEEGDEEELFVRSGTSVAFARRADIMHQGHPSLRVAFPSSGTSRPSSNYGYFRTWLLGFSGTGSNEAGDVMMSFWAKVVSGSNVAMHFTVFSGTASTANLTLTGGSSWTRYSVALKPTTEWWGVLVWTTSSSTVDFALPKVEYGNVATDWTPAPEDNRSDYTELSARIELTEQSITNMVTKTEFNSLSGTVSNHTSQITQLNNQITSKVSSSELTEKLKGYVTTTTYNNKMSSIDQSLSSITSRVTNTETNINTIDGSLQSITERVSAAEQKITDEAINMTVKEQTKQIADEAVADLLIGGTNLVKGSATRNFATGATQGTFIYSANADTSVPAGMVVQIKCTVGSGTTGFYSGLYVCVNGKRYTWSFYARANRAHTVSEVGFENGGRRSIALTTTRQRFTHTFTANSNGYKSFTFYNSWQSGDIIYIDSFKLEEGDKATDWDAHPDDANMQGDNLLPGTKDFDGWTTNGSVSLDTSMMYQGLTPTKTTGNYAYKGYNYTFVSGKFYTLSGWVRANVANAVVVVFCSFNSGGQGHFTIPSANKWYRFVYCFKCGDAEHAAGTKTVRLESGSSISSSRPLWVCGLKLEEGITPSPWTTALSEYSTTSEIKSSFEMTANGISLLGQEITLTGKVTFSMLASDVQGDLNKLDGLGDLAYKDKVSDAMLDETVIVGGYLKTSLIDVDNLYVKHLEGADGVFTGSLQAATGSFSGEVTASSGKIGGWVISEHDLRSEDFVYPNFTQPSGGNGGGLVSGGNGSMMRTDGIIINSTENGVLPASSGSIMAALINASGDNAWVQGAYIGAHCSSTFGYLSQVVALELSATNAYSGTPMNTPIALKIANGFPDIPGVLLAGYVYSSGISSKYKYGKKRTTSGAYQSTYGYGGVKQYQIIHNLGHSNYVVLVTPVSIGASWRKYHAHIVSQGPSDFFVAFIDSGTEGTLVQSDFMFAMIGNNT